VVLNPPTTCANLGSADCRSYDKRPQVRARPYEDEKDAIKIANDSPYGLGGFVQGTDLDRARNVASKIRAGYININNADIDLTAPFGGYKWSGNGREYGDHAFDEFLEVKSILGYRPKTAA
jgi:aldehyde dehydrogenase (NAD+)